MIKIIKFFITALGCLFFPFSILVHGMSHKKNQTLSQSFKIGFQIWLASCMILFPGQVMMALGWHVGWNNSFFKYYEESAFGPIYSLFGITLVIIGIWMSHINLPRYIKTEKLVYLFDYKMPLMTCIKFPISYLKITLFTLLYFSIISILSIAPYFRFQNYHLSQETIASLEGHYFLYKWFSSAILLGAYYHIRYLQKNLYKKAIANPNISKALLSKKELEERNKNTIPKSKKKFLFKIFHTLILIVTLPLTFLLTALIPLSTLVSQFFHYRGTIAWINYWPFQLPYFF